MRGLEREIENRRMKREEEVGERERGLVRG